MRKKLIISALVAIASFASVSCQREQLNPNEDNAIKELHFIVKAKQAPQTRSYITNNGDGTYTPYWNHNDKLGTFLNTTTISGSETQVDMTLTNTASDGENGVFEGTAVASGSGSFRAFYPLGSFARTYSDGGVGLNIGATTDYIQHPSVGSPDPNCDILVSKACDYISDGSVVVVDDLVLARPLSILKINLLGSDAENEVVSWLKFAVSDGVLSGRVKMDLSTSDIMDWTAKKSYAWAEYTSEKPVINDANDNTVYLVVNPTTIAKDVTVTITAETQNYNIEKSFVLPSAISFPEGGIAVINLTISSANCTAKTSDYYDLVNAPGAFEVGAKYVFAFKDGNNGEYNFIKNNGASNNVVNKALTVTADCITDPNTDYVFTAVEGSTAGTYLFKNSSEKYICNSSSANVNTNSETSSDWLPSYNAASSTYKLQVTDVDGRYLASNGSSAVKAYVISNYIDQVDDASSLAQYAGAISVFKYRDDRLELSSPTGLTVAGSSLSWTAVDNAGSYIVLVGNKEYKVNTNSLNYDGAAGYYDVVIVAIPSNANTYKNSRPATLNEQVFGTPTIATPVLANGGITGDSVTATWSDDSNAINGYHCEIYNGASKVNEKDVALGVQSVTFNSLASGVEYTVKVNGIAVTGAKNYAASSIATINLTTLAAAQHASDVTSAGDYHIEGLEVKAVINSSSFIAGDGTGLVYVFKSGHGKSVGNILTVDGTVVAFGGSGTYGGILEFNNPTVTKTADGNGSATHPSATSLTDELLNTYATSTVAPIYVSGTGLQDGQNITIGSNVIRLSTANASTDGHVVSVAGYLYGYNTSYSNYYFVATSISSVASLSIDASSKTWEYNEKDTFVSNVTVTGGSWTIDPTSLSWATVERNTSTNKLTVTPSGNNASGSDFQATITITHSEYSALSTTVTLKQKKQSSFTPFNVWEDSFASCTLSSTALSSLSGSTTGFTGSYSSISTVYPMSGAIRVGKASGAGSITTPVLTSIAGDSASLTITFKAAGWNGKTAKLTLTVSKGSVTEGQTTITSESSMSGSEPSMTGTSYTFHVTGADNTTAITFSTTNSIGIDDLVITQTAN